MGRKRLKQKSLKKVIAAVMTAVMILASSVPALAGGSKAGLPGLPDDFVTRRLTDLGGMGTGSASDAGQNDAGKSKQINDEVLEEDLNQDIMLASASSASIKYTLDWEGKREHFVLCKAESADERNDRTRSGFTARDADGRHGGVRGDPCGRRHPGEPGRRVTGQGCNRSIEWDISGTR